MPKYDRSDQASKEREFLGTRVYMAHHPAIRSLLRQDRRPTEFGHRVWDTTLAMMRHLDGRRFGRVLEIGCGWGLLGIHLARQGASVTCTDVDAHLAPVVAAHAALNGVVVSFLACGVADLPASTLACDLVVGVEVCYSDAMAADLVALVARTPRTTQVLIADPGRPDFQDLCDTVVRRFGATVRRIGADDDDRPLLLSVGPA